MHCVRICIWGGTMTKGNGPWSNEKYHKLEKQTNKQDKTKTMNVIYTNPCSVGLFHVRECPIALIQMALCTKSWKYMGCSKVFLQKCIRELNSESMVPNSDSTCPKMHNLTPRSYKIGQVFAILLRNAIVNGNHLEKMVAIKIFR